MKSRRITTQQKADMAYKEKTMSNRYGPRIVTDGLVCCLDAADRNSYPGSGTTLYDLSGSGYNASLVNGAAYNTSNGGTIKFDGSNDFANLSIPITFSQITMMFFVKYNVIGSRWNMILDTFRNGNVHKFTFHSTGGSTQTNMAIIGLNTSTLIRSNLTTNQWYCFGATYNGSTFTGYSDGISTNSCSATGTINLTNTIGIGARYGGGGFQNAYFPSLWVYNRALSADEMLQNYNATKGRFGL